jgi:hypothetical protein
MVARVDQEMADRADRDMVARVDQEMADRADQDIADQAEQDMVGQDMVVRADQDMVDQDMVDQADQDMGTVEQEMETVDGTTRLRLQKPLQIRLRILRPIHRPIRQQSLGSFCRPKSILSCHHMRCAI